MRTRKCFFRVVSAPCTAMLLLSGMILLARPLSAQEPAAWGPDLEFHTFSIVAVDPGTKETGVAVTTRNPCVGNAVPWVRAGVGAVATQGGTRIEYGPELLDLLAKGVSPKEALDRLVAADADRERRQVGVISVDGRSAQWTGSGQRGAESRGDWVAERSGPTFAVQGNSLVSPEVVYAVASAFQVGYACSLVGFNLLSDRLGAKPAFLWSSLAGAPTALAFAFLADGPVSAALLYGLTALSIGGIVCPF